MNKLSRIAWWIKYCWIRMLASVRRQCTTDFCLENLFCATVDHRVEGSLVDVNTPIIGRTYVVAIDFISQPSKATENRLESARALTIPEARRSMRQTTGSPRLRVGVMVPRASTVILNVTGLGVGVPREAGHLQTDLNEVGYHELVVFLNK